MLRRTIIVSALAVLLGVSSGMAGDVRTKTWSGNQIFRVGDTVITSAASFSGFYDFWVSVDSTFGFDTATNQDFTVEIDTDADDGNADNWQLAYKSTGARALPIQFHFLSADSLIFNRIRVRLISDLGANGTDDDSTYTADSTLTLGVHVIAAKR